MAFGSLRREIRILPSLLVGKVYAEPLNESQFHRDGYSLIRGVFSQQEVGQILDQFDQSYELGYEKQDLLSNPLLNHILLNQKIVELATRLLGTKPTYYGEGTITKRKGSLGTSPDRIHQDIVDRDDPKAPDWGEGYNIIKFGVYLQDYSRYSGGLIVRKDSHRHFIANWGRNSNNYLMSQPGDVAIWTLKTLHAGNVRFLRGTHVPLHPRLFTSVPGWLKKPGPPERHIIFFTLGENNRHLDRYMTYLKTRTRFCYRARRSVYTDELLHRAAEAGLDMFDLPEEIRQQSQVPRSTIGAHLDHLPLAYEEVYQMYETA